MNENKYNPNSLFNRLKFLGAMAVILAGALLIILALFTYFKGLESSQKLDDQSQQISELLQQNKDLAKQAKDSAKQAANYAYCNTLLIAKFSQNQEPFTVEDANKCVTSSFDSNSAPATQDGSANATPAPTATKQTQTQSQTQTSQPPRVSTQTTPPTSTPTPSSSPAVTRPPLLGIDDTPLTPGVHLTLPCLSLLFGVLNAC